MGEVSREISELLDEIGMGPPNSPDEVGRPTVEKSQLRKDEIVRVCDLLDIPSDAAVSALRDRIREAVDKCNEEKTGESNFSAYELRAIRWEIRRKQWVSQDEVSRLKPRDGDTIRVNGDEYKVTAHGYSKAHPEAQYESYLRVQLGDRKRLMVLNGLDTDRCYYEHGVVLESAVDYGPYRRWKKDAYVEDIEVVRNRVRT